MAEPTVEKTRRDEQTELTRRTLLDAAREVFTERGYTDTPTEEIVRRARVSRGALYHHFTDKKDLFRAVLLEVNKELTEEIAAKGLEDEGDLWDAVLAAVNAYLDGCLEPSYRRIVLQDGPAVFGWAEWRQLAADHGLGLIRVMLTTAMDRGVVTRQPIEPLASMIHAALNEAGMHIANADDTGAARKEVAASVFTLLEGLKTG